MANRREDELAQPVLSENQNPAAATDPNARPTYAGTFDDQLQEIFQRIQNREPFQYDVNADPLYQAAKDQYIQGGKLAMRDTMGKAAALTGGYGSTYGQQVGQQAFDAYLQDLTGVIPELYDMAYGMYRDEGADMRNNLAMYQGLEDTNYGQFMDRLGQWNTDRGFAYNAYRDKYDDWYNERNYNYGLWQDALSRQEAAAKANYQNQLAAYNKRDKEVEEYNSMLDDKYRAAIDAYAPKYSSEDADQYDYGVWKKNKGYEFMGRTYSSPDALMYAVSSAGLPTSTFTNTIKSMLKNGIITQAQYNELLNSRKG